MSDIQKESEYLNEHIEECRNRIKTIQDYIESNEFDLFECRKNIAVLLTAIAALQEKQHNDELRKRLYNIFGGDVTLDIMVDELQRQLEEPDKPHPLNAKVLTYEDADKWEKWKQLEKQGRLVELPCTVWGKIYVLDRDGKPRAMVLDPPDIRCHCEKEDNLCMALCDAKNTGICTYRFMNDGSDIGKRVFLTREAAQAALAGVETRL